MANEITLETRLTVSKGNTRTGLSHRAIFSQSGTKIVRHRQNVGVVEEVIDLGEIIAANSYIHIINRDPVNLVEIRPFLAATPSVRILAGQSAIYRFAGATTNATIIANIAPCDVEYLLVEP